ncbi:hypothetical protein AS156_13865 [Bradyrhizobium macuxiense]|uniref:Uncharacterized protein n=1 Tax=Bradyrhizobium macuxiense TaxID=1755647 RepID=A0A120FKP2_9BRAD|nr:hypothetical protein AS156_13865 [Bradyrhizobium macuxiense]
MREVGKPPRRSKAAVMASLKTELGGVKLPTLNRERLIEFGRKRTKQGAGPATLAIDQSFIARECLGEAVNDGEISHGALTYLPLLVQMAERVGIKPTIFRSFDFEPLRLLVSTRLPPALGNSDPAYAPQACSRCL